MLNSTDDLITVTQYIGLNEYENQDIYTVFSNPNTGIFTVIKSITHEKSGIQIFNVPVLKIDTINLKDIPAQLSYSRISGDSFEEIEKINSRKKTDKKYNKDY